MNVRRKEKKNVLLMGFRRAGKKTVYSLKKKKKKYTNKENFIN